MTPDNIVSVASAAKFLDEKMPGWASKISKPVKLADATKCILGQLGGYCILLKSLFNNKHPIGRYGRLLFASTEFDKEWQFEVDKRNAINATKELVDKLEKKPVVKTGDFDWAILQLRAGRDVQLEPGITFSATGNIDGYFFTYSQTQSKNWKLVQLKFHDLVRGDRFKFVSDNPDVSVHTKCNESFYITSEHFVCEHLANQEVERA